MNLNQITLPVKNMEETTAFYRRMGFLQIVDTPHYARYESIEGESTFSLSLESGAFFSGAVIYFECQHLDELVDTLLEKEFQFQQLPMDMSYGWREALLFDPSGNKIKLYYAGNMRKSPPWRVEIRDE